MSPRTPIIFSSSSRFQLTGLAEALPRTRLTQPLQPLLVTSPFSTTASVHGKRGGRKRTNLRLDPYRLAQAQQRKNANLQTRARLLKERASALGDPVRSKPTPFLATLRSPTLSMNPDTRHLNYFLDPAAADQQLAQSKWLTEPLPPSSGTTDPAREEERRKIWESQHENATTAIQSIAGLAQSSSKDRTRINVERCIETFGRHNTDSVLPPRPASLGQTRSASTLQLDGEGATLAPEQQKRQELLSELASIPKRAGPDTGSSEVQIAILTTKINILLDNLHKKDKVNKRNLRLLVHRRQKLLNYLRKKERGGSRWQNVVEQLGINDAMWKGEISL